jgi:replicative superfamily II helicase
MMTQEAQQMLGTGGRIRYDDVGPVVIVVGP